MERLRRFGDARLRSALAGSAVSFGTKLAASAAGIGLTVLIARRFGAAGSGSWVLATTILMIAGYVALCGLDYSTTRAVAIYRSEDRWAAIRGWTATACAVILVCGATVSLCLVAAAPHIANALSEGPQFTTIAAILSGAIIPYALLRLVASLLRGVQRFALAEVLETGLIPACLVVGVLALGIDDLGLVAALYVAIAVLGACGGMIVWLRLLGDRGRPWVLPATTEVLRRSLPMAGAVLATLASPWIMTLFLAGHASAAEVGIFRVALQFALLIGFLLNAVETGLSPQIAALHSQRKLGELLGATKKLTLLLMVLGGTPALVLFLFTAPFLSIMGPEFVSGANAMRILLAAQIFNLVTGPVGSFMAMTGLGRLSFWNALFGATIVLLISWALIPTHGIEGAALAGAAATVSRNLIATIIVWRAYGLFLPLGLAVGERHKAGQ